MSCWLCDLLGSLGCHAGSQELTGRKGGGETPPHEKTLVGRRTEWHVISIAALGIGWEDQYTSLGKNIMKLPLWICWLSKMLMIK